MNITSPNVLPKEYNHLKKVFLGGTINMGMGKRWQDNIAKELSCVTYNPYREDFRPCEQTIKDDYFFEQVDWEYKRQSESDILFYYFSADSQSPITLLELGLFSEKVKNYNSRVTAYNNLRGHGIPLKSIVVFCENGFWRKGNVEYICQEYNILMVNSFEETIEELKRLTGSA